MPDCNSKSSADKSRCERKCIMLFLLCFQNGTSDGWQLNVTSRKKTLKSQNYLQKWAWQEEWPRQWPEEDDCFRYSRSIRKLEWQGHWSWWRMTRNREQWKIKSHFCWNFNTNGVSLSRCCTTCFVLWWLPRCPWIQMYTKL